MSNKKKSFILHIDSLDILDDLTDEEAGVLFKAIKSYQKNEEVNLCSVVKIAFSPFRNQFNRDGIKYENLCEKNKLIAINRYKNKPTTRNQALPSVTKSTDKDSDSDSDSKNDNELIKHSFDYWWNLYPSKRRVNKKGCFKKWQSKCKNLKADQVECLTNELSNDIKTRIKNTEDLQYMVTTEPYLNQERWKDGE